MSVCLSDLFGVEHLARNQGISRVAVGIGSLGGPPALAALAEAVASSGFLHRLDDFGAVPVRRLSDLTSWLTDFTFNAWTLISGIVGFVALVCIVGNVLTRGELQKYKKEHDDIREAHRRRENKINDLEGEVDTTKRHKRELEEHVRLKESDLHESNQKLFEVQKVARSMEVEHQVAHEELNRMHSAWVDESRAVPLMALEVWEFRGTHGTDFLGEAWLPAVSDSRQGRSTITLVPRLKHGRKDKGKPELTTLHGGPILSVEVSQLFAQDALAHLPIHGVSGLSPSPRNPLRGLPSSPDPSNPLRTTGTGSSPASISPRHGTAQVSPTQVEYVAAEPRTPRKIRDAMHQPRLEVEIQSLEVAEPKPDASLHPRMAAASRGGGFEPPARPTRGSAEKERFSDRPARYIVRVYRYDRNEVSWTTGPIFETTVDMPAVGLGKAVLTQNNHFVVDCGVDNARELARHYYDLRAELEAMRAAREQALLHVNMARNAPQPDAVVPKLQLPTSGVEPLLRTVCVAPVSSVHVDGRLPTRRGILYHDAEVEVHCEVGYSEAATGLVELSVLRRGKARIKYGRFTCLNPDRPGGLILRPLPVTERPLASREEPQRYVLVHTVRFELVELCERAPEVQVQLQLGGAAQDEQPTDTHRSPRHGGSLRHHEFRFRLPILPPLFLQPYQCTPQRFEELWRGKELLNAAASSVSLGEDVAQSRDFLRQICTLGNWLYLVSEAFDPATSSLKLRIAGIFPAHGCVSSAPTVLIEVHARLSSLDATLVDLRADDFVLAKTLLAWMLWLLNPSPLPPLV
jgi:hypothetical protein